MRNGKRFVKPVKNVHSFIELSYYSNSLGAHFALDAVVICTLLKMAPNYCQASALDMVRPMIKYLNTKYSPFRYLILLHWYSCSLLGIPNQFERSIRSM